MANQRRRDNNNKSIMAPHDEANRHSPSSSHDDDDDEFSSAHNKLQDSAAEGVRNSVTDMNMEGDSASDDAATGGAGGNNDNNSNNDDGGSGDDDDDDDVYAQLEIFEHSLDVELEDLTKLGYLDTSLNQDDTTDDGSSDDMKNDKCEHNEIEDNDVGDQEDRMTFMPPPNSWFQLDDQYMMDGNRTKQSSELEGQEQESCFSQLDTSNASDEQQSAEDIITTKNEELKTSNVLAPSSGQLNNAPEDRESIDKAMESNAGFAFPEYNSPNALMFDLPQQAPIYDLRYRSDTFLSTDDEDDASEIRTTSSQLTSSAACAITGGIDYPTTLATSLNATLSTSLYTLYKLSSRTVASTIPMLLHEYSTSALQKSVHKLRLEYTRLGPKRYLRASDIGNNSGGYYKPPNFADLRVANDDMNRDATNSDATDKCHNMDGNDQQELANTKSKSVALGTPKGRDVHLDWMWAHDGSEVRFTTLPWVERQLVHEWRTYEWDRAFSSLGVNNEQIGQNDVDDESEDNEEFEYEEGCEVGRLVSNEEENQADNEEDDPFDIGTAAYEQARTLAPRPLPKPQWEHATSCYTCHNSFGPTLHRHHCRRCGHSYCNAHSCYEHKLPHLGYDGDVPERVCKGCKVVLDARDLEERVTWRLARCRDLLGKELTPYFETGVDTVEDAAYRLTRLAISLARRIPLGAQAYVAIETVEVLRKHGLKGVYGLLLRKEFLAAADLLCRVLGINKKNWPLSVHELSAAIFYALAQHRALRGLRPDGEELIHALKPDSCSDDSDCDRLDGTKAGWTLNRLKGDSGPETASYLPVVRESRAEEDSGNEAVGNATLLNQCTDKDDDEEAGDTIVWEGSNSSQKYLTGEFSENSVLDETDVYDPCSEKVVDILAMSTSDHVDISSSGRRIEDDDAVHLQKDTTVDEGNNGVSEEGTTSNQSTTETATKLPFDPVCEHVPNSLIASLLFYAPLALDFIYAECEVDMQLLAAQQGWRLVYASLDQNHHHNDDDGGGGSKERSCVDGKNEHFSDKPASALFAHDGHKIACLSIRGTATIQDVVTDIRAMPVPFPQQEDEDEEDQGESDLGASKSRSSLDDDDDDDENEWTSIFRGNGLALCGMAGAASNLFRETADSLLYLALRGYKIRIVGHSLGGGVAALLGILLLRHFEKQCCVNTGKSSSSVDTPSITDDGFVRVYSYGTPSCVDSKLADNPRTLGLCTSVVLHDDVVPRLTPTSVRGLLKHLLYIRETWVKTHLSNDLNAITERAYHVWPTRMRGSFTLLKKKGVDSAKRLKKSCKKRIQGQKDTKDCIHGRDESCDKDVSTSGATHEMSDADTNHSSDEGVDVEGDLFFDPLDDPLNESDDESSVRVQHNASNDDDWVPFDEPPMESNNETTPSMNTQESKALPKIDEIQQPNRDDDASPQILEELPLPRMFIPGKIVHIYTHRGGYKAAFVPRKFRCLRRVSLAGNCLSDHMARAYYEGLLEVKAIRAAKQDLPPWVGFAEDSTCACCASLFTWASTSNTEAQAARDKHNCRSCGNLVCDPCSKKRVPIPQIGIAAPVRVCDRCYNGWGTCDEKKTSVNSRRSVVVDELVSRIPSISHL